MSLTQRLFGRAPAVDLAQVRSRLAAEVRDGGAADLELTRARLADGLRDAAVEPPLPEEFDAAAAGFDGEASFRLAVVVSALDVPAVRCALATLAPESPESPVSLVADVVRDTPLLTAEVLRQSELRVEELARRLLAALGARVAGERPEVSRQRLERIDYGRLLADAERAREAAAGRVEQLRKLREEREKNRGGRGKW